MSPSLDIVSSSKRPGTILRKKVFFLLSSLFLFLSSFFSSLFQFLFFPLVSLLFFDFFSSKIISARNNARTFDGKAWDFVESYFLCIKLPNETYMTTQAGSDSILEEILKLVVKKKSFLLQKNEIAAEKFTFELPGLIFR